jgi:threonine dehydrogenase-like Zn-dependent dehydrogenase
VVKAVIFERNLPRFAIAHLASTIGSGRGARVAPLRLVDTDPPKLPGDDWHLVRPLLAGICGSDVATIDGRSSRYFEPLVSFPFVPGHEVVGVLTSAAIGANGHSIPSGSRVVVQPLLGCAARKMVQWCRSCQLGNPGNCEHTSFGHLSPGIQIGFCADTGGGWSTAGLVAHETQLYPVGEAMSDADAVTVEPLACALHAVAGVGLDDDAVIAVLGAGTLGLATVAAITYLVDRHLVGEPNVVVVGAKYAVQRKLAEAFGAGVVVAPDQLARAVRRNTRSMVLGGPASARLTGGADVVFDCVGSSESIATSLEVVRPKGVIVLVGMPGRVHLDLAPLWHREVRLVGTYAYGTETLVGSTLPTFTLALEAASALETGRLLSATYPLERFEEAVTHAGSAGRRGAVKIAFDLQSSARGGRR